MQDHIASSLCKCLSCLGIHLCCNQCNIGPRAGDIPDIVPDSQVSVHTYYISCVPWLVNLQSTDKLLFGRRRFCRFLRSPTVHKLIKAVRVSVVVLFRFADPNEVRLYPYGLLSSRSPARFNLLFAPMANSFAVLKHRAFVNQLNLFDHS